MRPDPVRAAAVVVPAHDEEQVLAACLASVHEACARLRIPTRVIVVADACRDATVAVSRAAGVTTVPLAVGDVGRARGAGMARALDGVGRAGLAGLWLATTDADSVVPPDWLVHQLDLARLGADAHVGTIRLADDGLSIAARRRFEAGYRAWAAAPGAHHPHVHGANLGFRASAYAAAGGFRPGPAHEDRDLVARLDRTRRVTVARSTDDPVVTSTRTTGRTPAGVAADLRGLGRAGPGPGVPG